MTNANVVSSQAVSSKKLSAQEISDKACYFLGQFRSALLRGEDAQAQHANTELLKYTRLMPSAEKHQFYREIEVLLERIWGYDFR